eukprot:TRINITY_DN1871_c0_g1_i6.p1 TRINITY_DN1871_c0_g1~~TRINITY_DN1871_c0_g1_i6.p1  ORF type:complete len:128 (-),score=11.45 TRINITY_DN1871_c0_g1_i6:168-551(-)
MNTENLLALVFALALPNFAVLFSASSSSDAKSGFEKQVVPLGMYLFQLLLNFIWTPLFFGMHKPGAAFADIVLLWFTILTTIYLFWQVTEVAAYLLVPYILWVSLASTINFYIWVHYTPETSRPKSS